MRLECSQTHGAAALGVLKNARRGRAWSAPGHAEGPHLDFSLTCRGASFKVFLDAQKGGSTWTFLRHTDGPRSECSVLGHTEWPHSRISRTSRGTEFEVYLDTRRGHAWSVLFSDTRRGRARALMVKKRFVDALWSESVSEKAVLTLESHSRQPHDDNDDLIMTAASNGRERKYVFRKEES